MSARHFTAILRVVAKYLWALPNTWLGLLIAGLTVVTGGHIRPAAGVLEVSGGFARWLLAYGVPLPGGASAMTLGHVVIGLDAAALDRTRDHERAHVHQAERWGPMFIPAYLLAGLWQRLRGRRAYADNPFERAARAAIRRESEAPRHMVPRRHL